jgi:hypothetical protein
MSDSADTSLLRRDNVVSIIEEFIAYVYSIDDSDVERIGRIEEVAERFYRTMFRIDSFTPRQQFVQSINATWRYWASPGEEELMAIEEIELETSEGDLTTRSRRMSSSSVY